MSSECREKCGELNLLLFSEFTDLNMLCMLDSLIKSGARPANKPSRLNLSKTLIQGKGVAKLLLKIINTVLLVLKLLMIYYLRFCIARTLLRLPYIVVAFKDRHVADPNFNTV